VHLKAGYPAVPVRGSAGVGDFECGPDCDDQRGVRVGLGEHRDPVRHRHRARQPGQLGIRLCDAR